MSNHEQVLLFPTFDGKPEVQVDIPELWQQFGLSVVLRSPDATGTDYKSWLEAREEEVTELAKKGTVQLMGNSNGGKIALSLLSRHPDSVSRVVICNTKIGPYEFSSPRTRGRLANLASTSDTLEEDKKNMTAEMASRVLCFRSEEDDVLDDPGDAELEGANTLITPTNTHQSGIEYVARRCGLVVAQFFNDGTVPTSV